MMKKLFLAIMAIFMLAISIAGCGTSPKEEAEAFNEKYYTQAYKNGYQKEFRAALDNAIKQYGNTFEADTALTKSFPYNDKINAIINDINNAKIENKEVEPLKTSFIALLNVNKQICDLIAQGDYDSAQVTQKTYLQRKFDYNNEYSKLVTGQDLLVMNTKIGQLYAHKASDVVFAITDISEHQTLGNAYFAEQAQGKFIAVKVISFNNQKDAVTIDSNLFKLINNNKQEYSTSVEGTTAMNLSNGNAEGFLQRVNPGMSIEATYIFDVPANSKISDYKLQARGGMTGDEVTMPLAVEKTGY